MIQAYILSIAYLLVSALLILVDYYRQELSFMLRLKAFLEDKRKYQMGFVLFGIIVGFVLIFFPIHPGPVFLGDLIPAIAIFFSSLYFLFSYSDMNRDRSHFYYDGSIGRRKQLGFAFIIVAIVHFLFPSLILL